MTPEQIWAAHIADPHGCCWVVPSPSGPVMCGLYCGHGPKHVNYVPGGYLLPQLLSALDALRARRSHWAWLRCPVCHRRADGWEQTAPGWVSWVVEGEALFERASLWRFGPCGCETRELLP